MPEKRLIAGENEGPSRMMSALDVSCAIVDGINSYLRELSERGAVDSERIDDGMGTELYELKYRIADSFARRWVGGNDSRSD